MLVATVMLLAASNMARGQDEQQSVIKVHVGDSTSGGLTGTRTAEVARLLSRFSSERECAELDLLVSVDPTGADFTVALDHNYTGENDIALFADGELVYAGRTRALSNAVKDACLFIAGWTPVRVLVRNGVYRWELRELTER